MLSRRMFAQSLIAGATVASAAEAPVRQAKVTRVFKSPDGHPNALETVPEGVWVGEQVTDAAYLMDWSGKVLKKVQTESSNTSGIAFGDGYLWMGANGKAIFRDAKPTDSDTGRILKVDPASGKTLARYDVPGGGGVHGLEFTKEGLWITSLKLKMLSLVDPKTFAVKRQIPCKLNRAHGLAWDNGSLWCMFSTERQIHRLDPKDGTVKEVIQLSTKDPDPHGMCLYKGKLYYCDAGIAPGAKLTESGDAGWVVRVEVM